MENEELVLIVAKCNVNHKYYYDRSLFYNVLIVAKCNVNRQKIQVEKKEAEVLIVAKCIVNPYSNHSFISALRINSSKVYCKLYSIL